VPAPETINLKLIPVSKLIPHEETVPHLSDRLTRRMMRDGVQRDPIVVDEGSMMVLDGMHRLEALRRMGAASAVCFLVDFMGDRVKLFRWFRLVENPEDELVSEMRQELGMVREVPLVWHDAGFDAGLTLTHRGRAYASVTEEGAVTATKAVRAFDRVAKSAGAWIEYVDEGTASPDLLKGNYMALLTPRFKKEEVVHAAMEGKPFPPKTTLQVFPVRPMGINYPIEALRSKGDILERILATRTRRRIDPPSFYRGRLYREPVVVFE
jgi:hypothetical protein